jgi:hypothetical protein
MISENGVKDWNSPFLKDRNFSSINPSPPSNQTIAEITIREL